LSLYDLVNPILYRMDPERAHSIGVFFMRFLPEARVEATSLRVKTSFGEIRNPVGLAAGFDKTGKHLSTLQKLGFGYLVAGTITQDEWPGHPKPRVVRNVSERTLVNCLGFPNPGADQFIENIRRQEVKIPIIASVSGRTESSILECYSKIQPHVSGIELNLSSPNTANLKDLREREPFDSLANNMLKLKKLPTFLKVPPFSEPAQTKRNLEMIKRWSDLGFEGVTASNALPVSDPRLSVGSGGYSGPPLFKYTLEAIKDIRRIVPSSFEINSVGGISSASEVKKVMSEGANTVQLMTSLVYGGPGLIKQILKQLEHESITRNESIASRHA
jgi:dihydroorotate dehydrogenase